MEGDTKKEILSVCRNELETICSRLAGNGEESVILTVNMAEKSCHYITSQIGEKFLSGRIELLEQFFKFCHDLYAPSSSTKIRNDAKLSEKKRDAIGNSVCKDNLVTSKCYTFDIQDEGDKNISLIQDDEEFSYDLRNKGVSQIGEFEKVVVEKDKNLPVDDSYALQQNDLLISMEGSDNNSLDDDYCTDSREENKDVTLKLSSESQSDKHNDLKGNRKRKHMEKDHDAPTRPIYSEIGTVKKRALSAILQEEKMENDVSKTTYGCPVCGKSFSQCKYLSSHMASTHLDRCSICKDCGAMFDTVEDLRKHKLEHTLSLANIEMRKGDKSKKVNFTCPTCGERFNKVEKLSVHMKSVHLTKCNICGECGKMFDSRDLLRKHKLEHTNLNDENTAKSAFTCPTCGHLFARAAGLAFHMAAVHLTKCSVCKHCGQIFDSKEELINHKKEHEEEKIVAKEEENGDTDEVKFSCPTCNKKFLKFKYLSSHWTNVHMDKRSICNICCKVFDLKEDLIKHKTEHTKVDTKKLSEIENTEDNLKINLTCPTCGETFSDCKYLSVHMKSVHFDKRSVCIDCGRIFYSKAGLIKHQKEHEQSNDENATDSEFEKDEEIGKIKLKLRSRGRRIKKPLKKSKQMSKKADVKQDEEINTVSDKNLKINFTCPIATCEKTFLECRYLTGHMKSVHDQKCFICRYCGKFCDSEEDRRKHKIEHVNSNFENPSESELEGRNKVSKIKFSCEICGRMFSQGRYITGHMAAVHKKKGITCRRCGKFFKSAEDLKRHRIEHCNLLLEKTGNSELMREGKYEVNKFICPHCGRMFSKGRYLTLHMAISHQEKVKICFICGRVFNSYDNVLKHKIKHTQLNYDNNMSDHYGIEEGEMYIQKRSGDTFTYKRITESTVVRCDGVNKAYRNDKKGLTEENLEDMDVENNVELDIAIDNSESSPDMTEGLVQENDFEQNESVSVNNEAVNSGNRRYSCEHCGRRFNVCKYLLAHLKYVHGDGRSVCKYCSKTFATPPELRQHYKLYHRKEKKFNGVCEYCGKSFKSSSQLDVHRRFHKGEKPYKCKLCGNAYMYFKSLKSHVDVYHGLKKYQCDECGQMFRSTSALTNHVKLHKTDATCSYCNSQFKSKDSFHLHLLREHADLLDLSNVDFEYYKCEYCSKLFAAKQQYERHVASHTGESKLNCEVCGKELATPRGLENHRYIHNPVKRYTCEICNTSTNFKTKLQKHFASNKHRSNCEKLGITIEESKKKVSIYWPEEEVAQHEQTDLLKDVKIKMESSAVIPIAQQKQIAPNNDVSKDMKRDFSKEIPLAVSSIEDGTTECVIITLPDNIALPIGEGEITYDLGDGKVIHSII